MNTKPLEARSGRSRRHDWSLSLWAVMLLLLSGGMGQVLAQPGSSVPANSGAPVVAATIIPTPTATQRAVTSPAPAVEDLDIPDELPPAAGSVGIQPAPGQNIARPKAGEAAPPVATPIPGRPVTSGRPEVAPGAAPVAPAPKAAPDELALPDDPVPAMPAAKTSPPPAAPLADDTSSDSGFGFMRHALYAGLLVALMCSYLGLYVVLKRIVFVGVALAEVSTTGIALAMVVGFSPMLGALSFMLLGVILFSMHWSPRRVPHESYIGVVYSVASALSILLIAKSPGNESNMLSLMKGEVLTVDPAETMQMLIVFAVVALIHAVFSKEFILVSFDRESANTIGYSAAKWDMLLFLTIGVVIAFSIRSVGALLTSAMLILPAATALLITNRLRHASIAAPILGVIPVFVGLYLSIQPSIDLPASALIVMVSLVMLLPAVAYSVWRGRA